MFEAFQYRVLRRLSRGDADVFGGNGYAGASKLRTLLGDGLIGRIAGRVVIDFGCGEGAEAVEMAREGAARVIGIDIREQVLSVARSRAASAGLAAKCEFGTSTGELADVIVSIDAFEHFANPAEILRVMAALLKPGGELLISFGPTWYHPRGGHLFSVFPWAHLIFSERALIRWRSDFKTDGATRFGEVAGGLNQMTIRRFEQLLSASGFTIAEFEAVPIRKLRAVHNRLTREFTTAVVRCRAIKRTGD